MMLRLAIYSLLGIILGAFIALIGIGILVSALPNVSLIVVVVWTSACVLACATAGASLARRMNKREAQQAVQSVKVPSEGYVAAYIYAISTLVLLLLGATAFAIFLFIPQSTQVVILDLAARPTSIPFLFAGSVLLYILSSYVGIWYVAHVKHLDSSHSPAKIAWWFALVVLIPAVGDWQAFLTYATSNPLEAIIVIAIFGSLAVLVVKQFIQSAQKRAAPITSNGTQ